MNATRTMTSRAHGHARPAPCPEIRRECPVLNVTSGTGLSIVGRSDGARMNAVNDALRTALADARMTSEDLAARIGVDPKMVTRLLIDEGRTPHRRHRWQPRTPWEWRRACSGRTSCGPQIQARFSDRHISMSVWIFDADMVVTTHLADLLGHDSPTFHLRRRSPDGLYDRYASHVAFLWSTAAMSGHD